MCPKVDIKMQLKMFFLVGWLPKGARNEVNHTE